MRKQSILCIAYIVCTHSLGLNTFTHHDLWPSNIRRCSFVSSFSRSALAENQRPDATSNSTNCTINEVNSIPHL